MTGAAAPRRRAPTERPRPQALPEDPRRSGVPPAHDALHALQERRPERPLPRGPGSPCSPSPPPPSPERMSRHRRADRRPDDEAGHARRWDVRSRVHGDQKRCHGRTGCSSKARASVRGLPCVRPVAPHRRESCSHDGAWNDHDPFALPLRPVDDDTRDGPEDQCRAPSCNTSEQHAAQKLRREGMALVHHPLDGPRGRRREHTVEQVALGHHAREAGTRRVDVPDSALVGHLHSTGGSGRFPSPPDARPLPQLDEVPPPQGHAA